MSPTATVAAALKTWAEGLGLSNSPTVTTEPPTDGNIASLPTLAIWFPSIAADPLTPPRVLAHPLGVGVYQMAALRADVTFRFRCKSYTEADTVRDEFRALWQLSAIASNANGTPGLRLPVTLRGWATKATLKQGGPGAIYQGQPSVAQDLWTVDFSGVVEWPEIVVESGAGTGLLNIFYSVNGGAVVDVETQTATPSLEA